VLIVNLLNKEKKIQLCIYTKNISSTFSLAGFHSNFRLYLTTGDDSHCKKVLPLSAEKQPSGVGCDGYCIKFFHYQQRFFN
jgi:hypothetical protein